MTFNTRLSNTDLRRLELQANSSQTRFGGACEASGHVKKQQQSQDQLMRIAEKRAYQVGDTWLAATRQVRSARGVLRWDDPAERMITVDHRLLANASI